MSVKPSERFWKNIESPQSAWSKCDDQ